MHLLLLEDLLLSLEFILMSLKLCKVGSGLLSLSCLILLYPLKNSNQSGGPSAVQVELSWNCRPLHRVCVEAYEE